MAYYNVLRRVAKVWPSGLSEERLLFLYLFPSASSTAPRDEKEEEASASGLIIRQVTRPSGWSYNTHKCTCYENTPMMDTMGQYSSTRIVYYI